MYNNLGDEGAEKISFALSSGKCPYGLKLDLSLNNLGHKGVKYIAQALSSGRCPRGLNLKIAYNEISEESFRYIAKALKSGRCPLGLTIDMSNNDLRKAGVLYIEEVLEQAIKDKLLPQGISLTNVSDRVDKILVEYNSSFINGVQTLESSMIGDATNLNIGSHRTTTSSTEPGLVGMTFFSPRNLEENTLTCVETFQKNCSKERNNQLLSPKKHGLNCVIL